MKFSTRMLLMSVLLSVSFLATAGPPIEDAAYSEPVQTGVCAAPADFDAMFVAAIRTEEDMPTLQRVSDRAGQRMPNPFEQPAAMAMHHYQPPVAASNSGIGRHTQHRT